MKRFIQGDHRGQSALLPESLDDYVSDTNPVRVVDVFVDELDLVNLGFDSAIPADTGRPGYHPAILLKIYIYGYLNRIQSSRRLEREAQRNVELMWLTGRLIPDFKTIANFRPKPMTSGARADGRFNNDAFIYDAVKNEYICSAGEALIWRYTTVEKGLTLHRYWSSKCRGCAMKPQCTPSTERGVRRWEHEAVLEEMQNRLSNAPEMMRVRKRTVEHPFGTLKQWMGPHIS